MLWIIYATLWTYYYLQAKNMCCQRRFYLVDILFLVTLVLAVYCITAFLFLVMSCLVIPGAYITVLLSGRFKYIMFLPTCIYR